MEKSWKVIASLWKSVAHGILRSEHLVFQKIIRSWKMVRGEKAKEYGVKKRQLHFLLLHHLAGITGQEELRHISMRILSHSLENT